MRRKALALLILIFIVITCIANADEKVFGPIKIKNDSKKSKLSDSFSIAFSQTGQLTLLNGKGGKSADWVKIILNGKKIADKKTANADIKKLTIPVDLKTENNIKIIVKGLGAGVKLTITASGKKLFDKIIAIGDSLTAGMQDNTLEEPTQEMSYVKQVVEQIGADFIIPYISEPGYPARLAKIENGQLVFLNPGSPGSRISPSEEPDNLGVPGADANDVLNTKKSSSNKLFKMILGGNKTMLEKAVAAKPTFVFLWIGSNDVLPMTLNTDPDDHTGIKKFEQNYSEIITQLRKSGATVIALNLVDITKIAYLMVAPELTGIPSTNRISLENWILFLQGQSPQLTDDDILTPAEMKQIQNTVDDFNEVIERVCKANEILLFDAHSFFNEMLDKGITVKGDRLMAEFMEGIFSLDGVHPSSTANAILANAIIDFINKNYNQNIGKIDIEDVYNSDPNQFSPAEEAAILEALKLKKVTPSSLLK